MGGNCSTDVYGDNPLESLQLVFTQASHGLMACLQVCPVCGELTIVRVAGYQTQGHAIGLESKLPGK